MRPRSTIPYLECLPLVLFLLVGSADAGFVGFVDKLIGIKPISTNSTSTVETTATTLFTVTTTAVAVSPAGITLTTTSSTVSSSTQSTESGTFTLTDAAAAPSIVTQADLLIATVEKSISNLAAKPTFTSASVSTSGAGSGYMSLDLLYPFESMVLLTGWTFLPFVILAIVGQTRGKTKSLLYG